MAFIAHNLQLTGLRRLWGNTSEDLKNKPSKQHTQVHGEKMYSPSLKSPLESISVLPGPFDLSVKVVQ
ncbi:hypothetical protein L2E82_25662 [Cichorium intybus]|uniref:Uncharacterized protein n=1 Tax=Cichorium intybus TaxID=13427 RepID=A0ACB9E3V7_CICIN|nr:hypothetical protein L2E82_25662 [Cichorium intybus]